MGCLVGCVDEVDGRQSGVRRGDTFVGAIPRSRSSATSVVLLAHLRMSVMLWN